MLIRAYRAMECRTRIRIWLSIGAVAYSTVGALAQVTAVDRAPAASPWDSPTVLFAAAGFVLSCAGVLIGVGAFVQTVKQQNDAIAKERAEREKAIEVERIARQALESSASDQFARKDVLAAQLAGLERLERQLQMVLAALKTEA